MADPICRWRNSSLKQVMEFNSLFPTAPVDKVFGRDVVNKNWALLDGSDFFTTPYQLAAQMGLYYEDETMMYPRFDRRISLKEGNDYLKHWGKHYYAPNPYTRSMRLTEKPVVINKFLVNWAIEKGESALFSDALSSMFKETLGNTDILTNMINNFSEVSVLDNKVVLKDKNRTTLYPAEEVWLDFSIEDKKTFFEYIYPSSASILESSSTETLVRELSADLRKTYFVEYLKEYALKGDGSHISSSSISTYKGMFEREYVKEIVHSLFPQHNSYYDLVSLKDIESTKSHDNYKSTNETQNNALSATIRHYINFLDFKLLYGKLTPNHLMSNIPQSPFTTSALIEKIKSTGLIYSDSLVKRFAYALMTKPFVILSGLAGSGKTQLALAFAECLSEDVERQVRVVSVGADWTNREPLLGYPNALKSNEYVKPECGALDMLIEAKENPYKPYFLILDEMNLSVVERYFADFLSAMESKKPIALWKGVPDEEGNMAVPNEIQLPKNLYIIGTINVDETTYMFSPKVLDRAHVIEFKIAAEEMASFLETNKKVERHACHSACAGMAEDFLKRTTTCVVGADTTSVQGALNGFFKILKSVNAEFGYRTANEIYRYINNVGDDLGKHGALDTAILQKLLPKLHGSRKKLSPVLSALWQLCFLEGSSIAIESVKDFADVEGLIYPTSAEKILRMYRAVVDNGFTSFAEA